jgi:predicted ATPase
MLTEKSPYVISRCSFGELSQFHGRADRDRRWRAPVSAGDNGSGKTTLLDAIHYVLSAVGRWNSTQRRGSRADLRVGDGSRESIMRYNLDKGTW